MVGRQLAVALIPDLAERIIEKRIDRTYLHDFVPSTADNEGSIHIRRETNAGNPVIVTLVVEGVLAETEGIPQLSGTVAGSRNDLTVVSAESNAEDVTSVTGETSGGGASGQIPQTKGLIP